MAAVILRFSSLKRFKNLFFFFGIAFLSGSPLFAQCVALPTDYWLTGTADAGATPAGDQAVSTNTGTANGFTPTSALTGTPLYWYGPAISGMINAGNYTVTLWSDQPASPSNVTVQIGYSNPNGT